MGSAPRNFRTSRIFEDMGLQDGLFVPQQESKRIPKYLMSIEGALSAEKREK